MRSSETSIHQAPQDLDWSFREQGEVLSAHGGWAGGQYRPETTGLDCQGTDRQSRALLAQPSLFRTHEVPGTRWSGSPSRGKTLRNRQQM